MPKGIRKNPVPPKEVQLHVRVEKQLHAEFMEATRNEAIQGSTLIRDFMQEYVNRKAGQALVMR